MSRRNPWIEPRFGDVFQFISGDPAMPYPFTAFLGPTARGGSSWWGLDLSPTDRAHTSTPRVVELNLWPDPEDWELVERRVP